MSRLLTSTFYRIDTGTYAETVYKLNYPTIPIWNTSGLVFPNLVKKSKTSLRKMLASHKAEHELLLAQRGNMLRDISDNSYSLKKEYAVLERLNKTTLYLEKCCLRNSLAKRSNSVNLVKAISDNQANLIACKNRIASLLSLPARTSEASLKQQNALIKNSNALGEHLAQALRFYHHFQAIWPYGKWIENDLLGSVIFLSDKVDFVTLSKGKIIYQTGILVNVSKEFAEIKLANNSRVKVNSQLVFTSKG
jgi:hypothetical protein